jgi:hypothetical protein
MDPVGDPKVVTTPTSFVGMTVNIEKKTSMAPMIAGTTGISLVHHGSFPGRRSGELENSVRRDSESRFSSMRDMLFATLLSRRDIKMYVATTPIRRMIPMIKPATAVPFWSGIRIPNPV